MDDQIITEAIEQPQHIRAAHKAAEGRYFTAELEATPAGAGIEGWFWDKATKVYLHAAEAIVAKGASDPWGSLAQMLLALEQVDIDPGEESELLTAEPLRSVDDTDVGDPVAVVRVARKPGDCYPLVMLATKASEGGGEVCDCTLWLPGGVTNRVAEAAQNLVAGYAEPLIGLPESRLWWPGLGWVWCTEDDRDRDELAALGGPVL